MTSKDDTEMEHVADTEDGSLWFKPDTNGAKNTIRETSEGMQLFLKFIVRIILWVSFAMILFVVYNNFVQFVVSSIFGLGPSSLTDFPTFSLIGATTTMVFMGIIFSIYKLRTLDVDKPIIASPNVYYIGFILSVPIPNIVARFDIGGAQTAGIIIIAVYSMSVIILGKCMLRYS